jgi:hypothetical protein
MALEGTLKDFSLADIFQLIGIQKKTGVLTLKDGNEVVTVSFLNGNVVSADSLNKNLEDRLGHVLVKSGRISASQLAEALRVQRETLQRLGYLLVHNGYIKDADLREALRLQITQIVYRLFRWHDGEYHFSQEETVEYDRENFVPLSAENILMEGIRMIDEWPIIERKIRSFDMILSKIRPDVQPTVVAEDEKDLDEDLDAALSGHGKPRQEEPEDGLRLAQGEALIYELIDGQRTVQEIIDLSRIGEFEACRILYDLLSRNLAASAEAAPTFIPRKRAATLGPLMEKAAYAVLTAWVAVSLATVARSRLSGLPGDLIPSGTIDQIVDLITRNRIERIDDAVQVYYLQKGFYPDDMKELVTGRLVSKCALHDPWGRSFGFISTTEGYRIVAYDPGGVENSSRSIERLRLPRPPEEAKPPGVTQAHRLSPEPAGSAR